jgi:hypothetical protein
MHGLSGTPVISRRRLTRIFGNQVIPQENSFSWTTLKGGNYEKKCYWIVARINVTHDVWLW